MDRNAKKDEHYLDGKDKWTVHYAVSTDTMVNPGDYSEVTQYIKNGAIVGQTTLRKDKTGADKIAAWKEGIQEIPATAKKVK